MGADQLLEGQAQVLELERLAQEGEEASVVGRSGLFCGGEARHQDGRQRPRGGAVALSGELLEQLQAGHARQVEVHQREVEALAAGQRQRFGGVGGRAHIPALTGHELHEAGPQGVVVFDQQHSEAL